MTKEKDVVENADMYEVVCPNAILGRQVAMDGCMHGLFMYMCNAFDIFFIYALMYMYT